MLAWLAFIGLAAFMAPQASDRDIPGYERLSLDPGWCGPRLIYYFARCREVEISLSQLVEISRADSRGFATLSDLARAATKCGFAPVGVMGRPAQLLRFGGPAILGVAMRPPPAQGNPKEPQLHFIGLLRAGPQKSWILDPASKLEPLEVDNDILLPAMTGHALLLDGLAQRYLTAGAIADWAAACLAASPIVVIGGWAMARRLTRRRVPCAQFAVLALLVQTALGCETRPSDTPTRSSGGSILIDVEPKEQDLGLVLQEKSPAVATFKVRNLTGRTVTLKRGTSSCGCSYLQGPDAIEAGATVEFQMSMTIGTREGRWDATADLLAAQEGAGEQTLKLRAILLTHPGILLDPPHLLVHKLPTTKHLRRTVTILLPKVWPEQYRNEPHVPTCEVQGEGVSAAIAEQGVHRDRLAFTLTLDLDLERLSAWRQRTGKPMAPIAVVKLHDLTRPVLLDLSELPHPVLRGPTIVDAFALKSSGKHSITLINHTDLPRQVEAATSDIPGVAIEFSPTSSLHPRLSLRKTGDLQPGKYALTIRLVGEPAPFVVQVHVY